MADVSEVQIVFTEIPASNPERACNFYQILLGGELTRQDGGPNPIWLLPHAVGAHPVGHIYPGQPATDGAGMTTHFAISDALTDAMDRVKKGGGEVLSEIIEIPVGSFFYARDTEGNSLGLFKYRS